MKKLNSNIKEKPILTALLIAVIIGLICLIIFVLQYFEPARQVPPSVKVEAYSGQTLELEPIAYSWIYQGQESAIELAFDPNNYDYSNCTIYNTYNATFPKLFATPKTKFRKMLKTTYMYNSETGKYEEYENDANNIETYEQDIYLTSYSGNFHTYVSVYTMTYRQGKVSYVIKVVDQDNYGLGVIKEYKGLTLEQEEKIYELISRISGTEFLEDMEIEESKIHLTYQYRLGSEAANRISIALFSLIDNLEEVQFEHQNTKFWKQVEENNQIVQKEVQYTEPRIITRDSLAQQFNFDWNSLKETFGV